MRNFNIMGVHWKILFLGGGSTKSQYIGGLHKKGRGLGKFADLRGGLAEKRRVDTPMLTRFRFICSFKVHLASFTSIYRQWNNTEQTNERLSCCTWKNWQLRMTNEIFWSEVLINLQRKYLRVPAEKSVFCTRFGCYPIFFQS